MTTSLNGWPGISVSGPLLATGTVPGTSRKVTLRRDVLPLFLAFLADWHKQVMPIDGQRTYLGPDGWVYRDARTGAGLSNHASGTAVDVRYDVLKADHQRHMSAAQIAAVHRLLDKYVDVHGRRVFGWGGDWKVGTYCDEMHTELAQSWAAGALSRGTTAADVAAVTARLRIRPDGTVAPLAPGGSGAGIPVPPARLVTLADLTSGKPSNGAALINHALASEGFLANSLVRSYVGVAAGGAFRVYRWRRGFKKDSLAALKALGAHHGFTVTP